MAWYETTACAVCGKTIGKRYFWQSKPYTLGPTGDLRPARKLAAEQADAQVICAACLLDRFDAVQALRERERQSAD
jgi:hypothetical protein